MTTEDHPDLIAELNPYGPEHLWADEPEPPEWRRAFEIGGPTVSLAEAGAQSHLSVATIRRRLKAEQIPGAMRNADRSWSIPVASLVAEGIWTGTTAADDDDQDDAPSAPAPDLTAELVAMRHRAELAELERDQLRERVDDMRTAMRMLEAGPPRAPEPAPQHRRRWWQRKPHTELQRDEADRPWLVIVDPAPEDLEQW